MPAAKQTPVYELGSTPWAQLPTLTRVKEGTTVTTLGVGESITLVHKNPSGTVVDTYTAGDGDITHGSGGTWWCLVTTPVVGLHALHWTAVIGGGTWEWHDSFAVVDNA